MTFSSSNGQPREGSRSACYLLRIDDRVKSRKCKIPWTVRRLSDKEEALAFQDTLSALGVPSTLIRERCEHTIIRKIEK